MKYVLYKENVIWMKYCGLNNKSKVNIIKNVRR